MLGKCSSKKLYLPSSTNHFLMKRASPTWWHRSVIPALRKLRQEALQFKASLGYIVIPCLKKNKKVARHQWLMPIILAT
jgi:hypothetical protein